MIDVFITGERLRKVYAFKCGLRDGSHGRDVNIYDGAEQHLKSNT